MYTNPSNIIDSIISLLNRNSFQINGLIHKYQPSRNLIVLKGMRATLPVDAYPSLEIEPTSASNRWATTRGQRPRFNLQFTLTTRTDNDDLHVEYISTLASCIVSILTSPENLQIPILRETRWDSAGGLVSQVLLDSLVEDVTYNATRDGTVRVAEFGWFGLVHETFPEIKFGIDGSSQPTIIRPIIIDGN